jgi:hypothetical protein
VGRGANEREGLDTGMRGVRRVVDVGVRGVNEGREVVEGLGEATADEGEGTVEAASKGSHFVADWGYGGPRAVGGFDWVGFGGVGVCVDGGVAGGSWSLGWGGISVAFDGGATGRARRVDLSVMWVVFDGGFAR